MTQTICDVTDTLEHVRTTIAKAASAAGRLDGSVHLVAASKTVSVDRLQRAIDAGQTIFGENRVQEAKAKWPALQAANPPVQLHLVGPLQSNKARDAVALFDVIQSVDRPSVARALAKESQKQGRSPEIYIQVNTGDEAQKSGIAMDEVASLIDACRNQYDLTVRGLMCIPPVGQDPSNDFATLKQMTSDFGLPDCSMGMSGDYAKAIEFGATHVRVGSAIFGNRSAVIK